MEKIAIKIESKVDQDKIEQLQSYNSSLFFGLS